VKTSILLDVGVGKLMLLDSAKRGRCKQPYRTKRKRTKTSSHRIFSVRLSVELNQKRVSLQNADLRNMLAIRQASVCSRKGKIERFVGNMGFLVSGLVRCKIELMTVITVLKEKALTAGRVLMVGKC
jgi:hypothetical protein